MGGACFYFALISALHPEMNKKEAMLADYVILLEDRKASTFNNDEIAAAWNRTYEAFEDSRKKKLDAYKKAKLEAAKLYLELWREEIKIDKDRAHCICIGDFSVGTPELTRIKLSEENKFNANSYLGEECRRLGADLSALMRGIL